MKGRFVVGCALAVACATSASFAQGLRLGAWVSYTPLSLGDIYETDSGTATVTVETKKVDTGVVAGADLGMEVASGLTAGIRVGYLYGMPVTQDLIILFAKLTLEQSASYVPLMAGVSYHMDAGPTLSVTGSLYAGYGFASYTSKTTMGSVNPATFPMETISQEMGVSGSGVVADATIAAGVKLSPQLTFSLNLGYRYALVPQLTFSQDIGDGARKGDVVKKDNGENMTMDFSGIAIGGGIAFAF